MLSNNMKDLSNVSWEIFGMAGHLSAGRSGGDVFITKNTERLADLVRLNYYITYRTIGQAKTHH
ncbi:MAG: hypothetical protein DWH73_01920 [Planctomycetota bacterium]|nr:MAG: hypothetical protein DWH73_01920 [Planctomycetota bacterium]